MTPSTKSKDDALRVEVIPDEGVESDAFLCLSE